MLCLPCGGLFMAKPIRATPTLIGEEAVKFVAAMRRREKENRISHADSLLLELIRKNEKLFRV